MTEVEQFYADVKDFAAKWKGKVDGAAGLIETLDPAIAAPVKAIDTAFDAAVAAMEAA